MVDPMLAEHLEANLTQVRPLNLKSRHLANVSCRGKTCLPCEGH